MRGNALVPLLVNNCTAVDETIGPGRGERVTACVWESRSVGVRERKARKRDRVREREGGREREGRGRESKPGHCKACAAVYQWKLQLRGAIRRNFAYK